MAKQLAVVHSASEITTELLSHMPENYVVKGAHGAAMVMLVRGNTVKVAACHWGRCEESNRAKHAAFIAHRCSRWLQMDYGKMWGQTAYSYVRKSCVFESSLLDKAGNAPRDVKVFVVHGKPLFILDVSNRYSVGKGTASRHTVLDLEGNALAAAYGSGSTSCAAAHSQVVR